MNDITIELGKAFRNCAKPSNKDLIEVGGISLPDAYNWFVNLSRERLAEFEGFDQFQAELLNHLGASAKRYYLPAVLKVIADHHEKMTLYSIEVVLTWLMECVENSGGENYVGVALSERQISVLGDFIDYITASIQDGGRFTGEDFDINTWRNKIKKNLKLAHTLKDFDKL